MTGERNSNANQQRSDADRSGTHSEKERKPLSVGDGEEAIASPRHEQPPGRGEIRRQSLLQRRNLLVLLAVIAVAALVLMMTLVGSI